MKPLDEMCIPCSVIITAAMGPKSSQFLLQTGQTGQTVFLLSLENMAAWARTLGEVDGLSVLSNMQFLAPTRSQATGATLKGGSTVEHTGFLTQDRDRAVTGPWPNEKIRTLECWGLVRSCWLLRPTPRLLFLVSVSDRQPFLESVLYSEMVTFIHVGVLKCPFFSFTK